MSYGWRGKKVRHEDGREGVIRREEECFTGVDLIIRMPDGSEAVVRLNSQYKDSGETGWSWWCEDFSLGARWLPLGDHNPTEQEPSC